MAMVAHIPAGTLPRTLWSQANWIQRIAAILAGFLILVALIAPLLAPFDPLTQSLISRLRPPVGFDRYKDGFFLGTDELGRDVLSRTMYGLRLTLGLALVGACIGLLIGGALGLLAGMRRGWVEDLTMGAVDIQIAVPFTLIALL
ncbi:MAG: ABC transporter permease, partial [Yoonia sp.]|nr:ABC transporter permease [Yoonia sp.]